MFSTGFKYSLYGMSLHSFLMKVKSFIKHFIKKEKKEDGRINLKSI
jgi:hypothetical protein